VAVIRRSLLDLLPDTPVCSIVDALETAMARGLPVRVVPLPTSAYWEDLGTPEAYVTAHRRVTGYTIRHHSALAAAVAEQGRRRSALCATGVRLTGAVGLGRDAGAAPGTHLHNTVLWDGVQVPGTALWTDHVFTADPTSPPPLTPDRTPDARLLATIDAAPDQVRLTPGYVRASQRMYRRVQHSDGRSWIWCAYARERDENNSFPALARFLADQGLRVPRVLHHLADVGEMLLQDLGDRTLDALPAGPALDHHLHEVIEQVARLHTLPDRCIETAELPLQPEFTDATYDWEVDYFREFFLGTTLDAPELWETAAPDYRKVRNTLHRAVPSLVHRDLQSANVMLYEGQAYIIDFQGMRRGPAAYDLASLLYDPYRCHERALRSALLDEYGRRGGRSMTVQALACGAVQRLLQALGAYGKLWMCERRDWYREHLIAGVNMLEEAAWDHTGLPGITDLARTARTRLTARMARGLV
jgi:aminoglycoside/choline kinase family phosphotransferase